MSLLLIDDYTTADVSTKQSVLSSAIRRHRIQQKCKKLDEMPVTGRKPDYVAKLHKWAAKHNTKAHIKIATHNNSGKGARAQPVHTAIVKSDLFAPSVTVQRLSTQETFMQLEQRAARNYLRRFQTTPANQSFLQ